MIEVLLAAAAAQHTLVLGTRGNGGFNRLLLGSVSTAAVHHAPVRCWSSRPPAAR